MRTLMVVNENLDSSQNSKIKDGFVDKKSEPKAFFVSVLLHTE